jgi:hypothetical protein
VVLDVSVKAPAEVEVIQRLFAGFSPGSHAVGGLLQDVFPVLGAWRRKGRPGLGLLSQYREKPGMKQMFSKSRPVLCSSGWTRSISGLKIWRGKNKL